MSLRRQVLIPVAVAMVVAACAPRQVVQQEPPPCMEPLYLRLKSEAPDSLSDREWIRLQDLERACTSARASAEHRDGGGMMLGMRRDLWWTMTALMASGAAMLLMMGWWR